MRPILPSLALPTALCLALMLGSAARAEPGSGWVDPPARPGPAASRAAPSGETNGGSKVGESRLGEAGPPSPRKTAGKPPATEEASRPTRRSRLSERRERRMASRGHHRPAAASSEIDASAPDPRISARAGTAQRLTEAYLASVSAPNATMLEEAPRFYGDRVRFHGRVMSTAALIAEKRRFVRRWPERRYAAQGGTMRTACDAVGASCVVRAVMGFRAENPARGARSLGLSELTLTVSFAGGRPVIVAESSRVLRRGSAMVGAAGRGRDDGA